MPCGLLSLWHKWVPKAEKRFLKSKARPVRKADNLTTIYEPIIYTLWDH
jgi:hypothetical protein